MRDWSIFRRSVRGSPQKMQPSIESRSNLLSLKFPGFKRPAAVATKLFEA
jgi:hypothetical protein